MAREKRASARNSGPRDAPNVYDDMLAEAGVSSQQQQHGSPERPLKRRRPDPGPGARQEPRGLPRAGVDANEGSKDGDDDEDEDIQFEDVSIPAPTVQTTERDSDEDDDEDQDVEFEDVDLTAPFKEESSAANDASGLQLNLSAARAEAAPSKRAIDRRKPLTREDKNRRAQVHQAHLLCLVSHVARRNHWCNDARVQELLRPHLPDKTVALLNPRASLSQLGRAESLKSGLQQAITLWRTKFEISERGLRRALWAEEVDHLQHYEPPEDMETVLDRQDFRDAARDLQGSRDVGAQLFCALLRSAGVRARLVCSLQPLACAPSAPTLPRPKQTKAAPTSKPSRDEQVRASMVNHVEKSNAARASVAASAGSPTARRRLGRPGAASYAVEPSRPAGATSSRPKPTFNTPKRIRQSAYPVYWVEVLDVGHQKWHPVDPLVTHTFWKPRALEPPVTDRENSLSYAVAFEADGTAKDVTRRYAKAYTAKTRRLRIESALEDGDRWWRKALKPLRRRRAEDLDQIEDNELAGVEAREPMPRNVQDFKDHPVYALERHLRRHEVLVPGATPSGTVGAGSRGPLEKIYRRRDVRVARSADKWYRMGREVKPNEIPVKWLPARARPNGSRHDTEDDSGDNHGDVGTPIYTLDQTELYQAPPVRNGRVPKNKFGNIDVYVPSMVPRGAVHIQHEQAARAAYLLGIDYAPALTGFSFRGRQGTAVLSGVVVAEEHGEAVRAVIEGLGDVEREAEEDRRRLRVLRTWRRLLMGLRIRERVWRGVDEEERREADRDAVEAAGAMDVADAPSDVTEEFDMVENDDEEDGGGFVVDDDGGGGGFVPE